MEDVLPEPDDDRHLIDMEATYPSNRATIVGIFCIKFALSRNAIEALIELLRLKMDVSEIKNVDQVLSSMTSAHACLHNISSNCFNDLDIDGSSIPEIRKC